jgi:hypothetical protein
MVLSGMFSGLCSEVLCSEVIVHQHCSATVGVDVQ